MISLCRIETKDWISKDRDFTTGLIFFFYLNAFFPSQYICKDIIFTLDMRKTEPQKQNDSFKPRVL